MDPPCLHPKKTVKSRNPLRPPRGAESPRNPPLIHSHNRTIHVPQKPDNLTYHRQYISYYNFGPHYCANDAWSERYGCYDAV